MSTRINDLGPDLIGAPAPFLNCLRAQRSKPAARAWCVPRRRSTTILSRQKSVAASGKLPAGAGAQVRR